MFGAYVAPELNSTKLAEFITPTMALFANTTAANFKKGNIIMFAMGSSCPGQVAPRADRCLGGQFACAPMYYGVFWTIVDVTNGGVVGVDSAMRKGREKV